MTKFLDFKRIVCFVNSKKPKILRREAPVELLFFNK